MAFEVIVREYDDRLRAFTYSLVRDHNAMDDVLQDVYLKAYRALPSFRRESRLSTWLLRIAYTTAMSHLRAVPREESADARDEAADERVTLDDVVERIETADQLSRALATLPAELRACILLVHREGLSYQDAASVLGVAPGTVGWRLSTARRRLLEALEGMSVNG
jgi:RNA polymerase sigma-70 factor, ECF subfamily